jgi:exopolyphosphatase/guanosine-5'-triphosphate,3'-diphosphate pyrophosphatase
MNFAAIDCGTNSVRLLIGNATESLVREMRITRLGRGVDNSGRLSAEGIAATLAALEEFSGILKDFEVAGIRMTATSAARDAANREEFFAPAAALIGVAPELLTGAQEAELSFQGATRDLAGFPGPYLVVDIGGGSTEFALGTQHCERSISVDVGCVRVTERFLESDPPTAAELSNALSVLDLHWDDVRAELGDLSGVGTLIGTAGTVVTVAAVEIGLAAYDRNATHHFRLTKPVVEEVFRTLATEPLADRLYNPGLEAQRADVIVGGCCVLVSIMRKFGFTECLVSESDILDGLLFSQFPD